MPYIIEADGARVFVNSVVIQSEAASLQAEAEAAQAVWLADPTPANRAAYAMRLRHWAKCVHNARALARADELETEI